MRTVIAAALMALFVIGCDDSKTITVVAGSSVFTVKRNEALSYAALHNLRDKLLMDVNHKLSKDVLDCEQQKINKMRAWAKTIADADVRAAYQSWIDYADRQVAESRQPEDLDPSLVDRQRRNAEFEAGKQMAPDLPQPPTDLQCEPTT
jgi:hypothetical protein